jgi:hypothetical protein
MIIHLNQGQKGSIKVYFSTRMENQCLVWAMQGLPYLLGANMGSMMKKLGLDKGFQDSSNSSINLESKHNHKGMLLKLESQGMLYGLKIML